MGAIQAAVMTVLWSGAFALKYAAAAVGFQLGPLIAAGLLAYAVSYVRQPARFRGRDLRDGANSAA